MADYRVPTTPLVVAPELLPKELQFQVPKDNKSKVDMAVEKMNELLSVQKKVDAAIEKLPPGAERDRLIKARKESRGFVFQNIITPAWNKIREWTGQGATAAPMAGDEAEELDAAFGVLPLIPIAVITSSTAIISYIGSSLYSEYKILNDPTLTAAQKTQLIQSKSLASTLSSVGSVLGEAKWLAIAAIAGFIAFQYMKRSKRA